MKLTLRTSVAALAIGFALAGSPAVAQVEARNVRTDDVVVVTGARELDVPADNGALGAKSVLDTPFSITVIDAAEIAERQPLSLQQVFINDPSVFSFASAGTVNWWGTQIRGLGVRNYYVDDAPIPLYWGGDYPLEAIETVQALKGATGFMHGFGAPGGAISYRTKRPTSDRLLTTEVGFRGRSVVKGHVDAGGQFGESGAGYRVNVAGETGEEYNGAEIERGLASLAVDYEIAPNLVWRSNLAYEHYDLGGEPFHIYWVAPGGSSLPAVPDDWDNLNVDNSFYRYNLLTGSTGLEWALSQDWSVDLKYGYTRKRHSSNKTFVELDELGDYAGYVYQFGELDVAHVGTAILKGGFTTGPVRHELVAGTSYQFVSSDFGANYVYSNDFNGSIYGRQPYLITGPVSLGTDGAPYEERQTAAFVSDTLYFGEQWQAIVGLRQTYFDLDDVDGDPATASGYSATATTPTLALLYKPVSQATIYASYVESMEGGGVVLDPIYTNYGDVLEATVSNQAEIGAKYDGTNSSLTAAVFRIERVGTIDQIVGADRFLRQDGLTVYQGVEVVGDYNITSDLTVGLGAVYLDAKIKDVSEDNIALQGNRPAESYEWQILGNVEYEVAAMPGLSLHGNVRYFGDAPTSDVNDLIIPDYTLVSAGFNYDVELAGKPVTITGNLSNLLKEKYWGLQNFGETINGSIGLRLSW